MSPTVSVDVYGGDTLDVSCHTRGQKLSLNGVHFHGLSDEQFQTVVDVIESYLIRRRRQRLKERDAIAAAEAEPKEEPREP